LRPFFPFFFFWTYLRAKEVEIVAKVPRTNNDVKTLHTSTKQTDKTDRPDRKARCLGHGRLLVCALRQHVRFRADGFGVSGKMRSVEVAKAWETRDGSELSKVLSPLSTVGL
jgi:hypothetical protein